MTLGNLALGSFIRTANRTGQNLGTEFAVIYEDLKVLWDFLKDHEGFLTNTAEVESVARISGVDATNLLLNPSSVSGQFYSSAEQRPITIYEAIQTLFQSVDTSLANELPATELQSIKNTIGINKFDDTLTSIDGSLDRDINKLSLWIKQLAADCFNYDTRQGAALNEDHYSFNDTNLQTQHLSLADKIDRILNIHGSLGNLGHHDVNYSGIWAVNWKPNAFLASDQKVITAPYSAFEDIVDEANITSEASRFYNTTGEVLILSNLTVIVGSNSLDFNTIVTLYKNGNEEDLQVSVGQNHTGLFINENDEIEIHPNQYIQFHIDTGPVTAGGINILNISIRAKEKVN